MKASHLAATLLARPVMVSKTCKAVKADARNGKVRCPACLHVTSSVTTFSNYFHHALCLCRLGRCRLGARRERHERQSGGFAESQEHLVIWRPS